MNLIIHDFLIGEMRAYEYLWNYRMPYKNEQKIIADPRTVLLNGRELRSILSRPVFMEKEDFDWVIEAIRDWRWCKDKSIQFEPLLSKGKYVPPPLPRGGSGGGFTITPSFRIPRSIRRHVQL